MYWEVKTLQHGRIKKTHDGDGDDREEEEEEEEEEERDHMLTWTWPGILLKLHTNLHDQLVWKWLQQAETGKWAENTQYGKETQEIQSVLSHSG